MKNSYVNRITGLDIKRFIERWDEYPINIIATQQKSSNGNINILGSTSENLASVVSRYNPSFYDHIEDGIKELMKTIVEEYNYITFSSCEGHREVYLDGKLIPLRLRDISIIPRNKEEESEIYHFLESVCKETNDKLHNDVFLTVELRKLTEKLDDFIRYWKTIDVVFESKTHNSDLYFAALEGPYQVFLSTLKSRLFKN